VAVSYHLVARTQSCMGDFRSALQNEKETYTIYKIQVLIFILDYLVTCVINFFANGVFIFLKLGEEHEKTKESSECLRHLTQQAVVLQKKMNELYQGRLGAGVPTTGLPLPPIQIQPPSMGSVLDMLNVINGILFVQIRY
jgi:protein TIF31